MRLLYLTPVKTLVMDGGRVTGVVATDGKAGEDIYIKGGKEVIEDGTFASRILEAQSTKIDSVSGATLTSNGVIAVTEDALAQARLN